MGHLGISLLGEVGGGLQLHAPLEGNGNHEGTAFAGSLNAVATLAGWGTVWLALHRAGLPGAVLIQDSATHYHAPVRRDFVATADGPGAAGLERLLAAVRRHGRGRIPLRVTLAEEGSPRPALEFTGRYVVVPPSRTR